MAPQIPKTMKALAIEEFNADPPYVLHHDFPTPSVGPRDVLIKITTAGYCHTEILVAQGVFANKSRRPLPLVPSHEPTGIIVAMGAEAEERAAEAPGQGSGGPLKVGDRVGCISFKDFCGKCDDCKAGNVKYCEDQDMVGVTDNGALAEYMTADYRSCIRLPEKLSYDAAAPLMCAGATIYTAIKSCNLTEGQSIAIIGAGALGHLGVQFAKCLGLKVVLVDARQPPLDMCKELKYPPDITFNSASIDPSNPEDVQKAIDAIGGRVNATIVACDAIPAFQLALDLTKKHGLYVVVGQPNPPIPIHFNHLIFRDLTIKGSLGGDPAMTSDMCELVVEKGIEVKTIAYPMEEIEQLRHDYALPGHKGKMVVHVSQG